MERLMLVGIVLIFIGIVFTIVSSVIMALSDHKNISVGFGGFVGLIPFGFFSNKKAFWIWWTLLAVGILIWIISRKL